MLVNLCFFRYIQDYDYREKTQIIGASRQAQT